MPVGIIDEDGTIWGVGTTTTAAYRDLARWDSSGEDEDGGRAFRNRLIEVECSWGLFRYIRDPNGGDGQSAHRTIRDERGRTVKIELERA